MRKLCFTIVASALLLQSAAAADSLWLTDLPKAQAQARAEGKLVFVNFTGSDW